jgi:aminoglycoside phosphotransferase (APT) family kinase protein
MLATRPTVSLVDAFHRVLDPQEAEALVRDYLDPSGGSVGHVRPYFARPKGDEGGIAGYRVAMVDGSTQYVTVRVARMERLRSGLERFRSEVANCRGALAAAAVAPDHLSLLTTFPLDRRIPNLRWQTDIRKVRRLLTPPDADWKGRRVSKSGSTWQIASFRPERRAVIRWNLRVHAADGAAAHDEQLYVRAYAEQSHADRAWSAIWALEEAGFPAPRPSVRPATGLILEQAVAGQTRPARELPFVALGSLTARLHETPLPDGLPQLRPRWRLAHAGRAVRGLECIDETLWRRARRAWERLDTRAPRSCEDPRFLHGDLHPGQVVSGGDMSLVDFDRARIGSPASEVATLAAHLTLADPERSSTQMARFRAGYETRAHWVDGERLRWNFGVALLGLIDAPFRRVDPKWRATTQMLLEQVEAAS